MTPGLTRGPAPADLLGLARSLAIYYGQVWKPPRLRRFHARFVQPGDLVFDIGAHVGNRTRALAALGAEVVAVEPQALCHALLRRIVPPRRVRLIRALVGATPGWAAVRVSSRHPTVSTGAPDWRARVGSSSGFRGVRWDRSESVPRTTLDALIAEHGEPAFCKIDVEGMELEILQGLGRPLPRLSLEVLPATRDLAEGCIDRLGELGRYRFNLVQGEGGRFAWSDWCDAGAAKARLAALRRPADLYAFRADVPRPQP